MTYRATTTPSLALVDQVIAQMDTNEGTQSAVPTIVGAVTGLLIGLNVKAAHVTLENFANHSSTTTAVYLIVALVLFCTIFYRRLPRSFQFSATALFSMIVTLVS